MIDISFEINNRKVSANNIGNAIESAMLESIRDPVSKSIGSIRCTEHGQRSEIKTKGRNLDSLAFDVAGCCDALIEQVNKKLNEERNRS